MQRTMLLFSGSARRLLAHLAIFSLAALAAHDAAAEDKKPDPPKADPPKADDKGKADATKGSSAEELAKKVQAFYDSTKTFKADFKQEYTIKVQNVKKSSSGKVVFEKPGKMSWTYDAPNGNRVVSDGKTIKVYEKENEQMFETPVKNSQYPAA